MTYNCCRVSNIIFKALCVLAAFFMVIFWVFKFQENEDVSAISYASYETDRNIIYPELSICITEPFIYQNVLWTWPGNDSLKNYRSYIAGRSKFRKEYEQVDFFNVTLNIFDYVQNVRLYMRNVNAPKPLICKTLGHCPYVKFKNNFNGLSNSMILRCFGFEVNLKTARDVKALHVSFKRTLGDAFRTLLRSGISYIHLAIDYPGQMLKNTENYQPVWKNQNSSQFLDITSSSIEILRRRNKNNEPCLADWRSFDETALRIHHDTVGCRPPYHQSDTPVCITETKLNESRYEINEIGNIYLPPPCEEISNIAFTADELPLDKTHKKGPRFYFTYPKSMKIIQQIKSVDLHSLIGNIGGYIGLFLGKIDRN